MNGKIGRDGGLEYMVTSNPDDNLEDAVNDDDDPIGDGYMGG